MPDKSLVLVSPLMGFNLDWCVVWYHKVNTQQTQKYIYKASSFEEDL